MALGGVDAIAPLESSFELIQEIRLAARIALLDEQVQLLFHEEIPEWVIDRLGSKAVLVHVTDRVRLILVQVERIYHEEDEEGEQDCAPNGSRHDYALACDGLRWDVTVAYWGDGDDACVNWVEECALDADLDILCHQVF